MVTLEAKLAFLRQPSSYPGQVLRVEAVETHMSWVFLTEQHAYKLKKPVNYGTPDFSTLEARHFFCDEEIRLNRHLALDVYLESTPLTVNACEHLQIGGPGPVADWLVVMRRLPANRMLDYLIKSGLATENDMARIAAHLAVFYHACLRAGLAPADYRRRFERSIAQSRETLACPAFRLPLSAVTAMHAAQQEALHRVAPLLDERVRTQHIVEGHGDLRTEHVCIEDGIAIIDCLEFSQELRIADPFDELGFLALECERFHMASLGDLLLHAYSGLSGDTIVPELIHFYKSVRASLRARLTIRHLAEERFRYSPEWTRRAMHYLEMAERHAKQA